MNERIPSSPPPPRRRRTFRIVIAIVALAALAYLGRHYVGELDRLAQAPLWTIAAIVVLYLVNRLIEANILVSSMSALGHRVRRGESFFLLVLQAYTNLLVPRAGTGAPATYFKVRHGIPVADFGAVQLLPLFVVQLLCVGLIGLAGQWTVGKFFGVPWNAIIAAIFAVFVVGCALLIVVPLPSKDGHHLVLRFFSRLSASYRTLGRNWRLLAGTIVSQCVVIGLRAGRLAVAFYAVGAPVNVVAVAVASVLSDIMTAVSVTPAALGFREGAVVYSAGLLGTTGDVALSAAVLDRLVVTACNIVLAQVALLRYVRPAATPASAPATTVA